MSLEGVRLFSISLVEFLEEHPRGKMYARDQANILARQSQLHVWRSLLWGESQEAS